MVFLKFSWCYATADLCGWHSHICYILSCVGYVMRQITSRRLGCSEFIAHSLLHLYNSQFCNYCNLQYHNYFSCWSHCHSLNATQLVAAGLEFILDTSNSLSSNSILTTHYCWIVFTFAAPYLGLARTTLRTHCCSATDIRYCCQVFLPMHCLAIIAAQTGLLRDITA
jgi:hypothetical protein